MLKPTACTPHPRDPARDPARDLLAKPVGRTGKAIVIGGLACLILSGCIRPAPPPTPIVVNPPTPIIITPLQNTLEPTVEIIQGTQIGGATVVGVTIDPNATPLPTIDVPIPAGTSLFPPVITSIPPTVDLVRPYPEGVNAQAEIAAAISAATAEGKYVLVDFGANWCPGCVLLSTYYQTEPLRTLINAKFRVVKVNIGRFDQNLDVIAQYGNLTRAGLPAIAIVQPPGLVLYISQAGELASLPNLPIEQVYAIIAAYQPG